MHRQETRCFEKRYPIKITLCCSLKIGVFKKSLYIVDALCSSTILNRRGTNGSVSNSSAGLGKGFPRADI
jgi:hypothetical protein